MHAYPFLDPSIRGARVITCRQQETCFPSSVSVLVLERLMGSLLGVIMAAHFLHCCHLITLGHSAVLIDRQ